MQSSSRLRWKSMRWSSAQPYRISNAEVNHAPFLLVPLAPILAGFSYGAGGFYDARNISTAGPRSSSRMFEPLFTQLSDHYHLIAPDYPGFGHSDWPDPKQLAYTFDHIAETMNHFTDALGLSR